MTTVQVMTYNIFRGGRLGSALIDVVRMVAPDVLCVNESPKGVFGWKGDCLKLSRRWGMTYVDGGRPAGSNMLAIDHDIRVKSSCSRTMREPLLQPRRGLVAAQLRVEGKLFGVVSCHLSLRAGGRTREVEQVIAAANALRGPVIVAGDLNERPGGPSWKRLQQAGYVDRGTKAWPTFPAVDPETRIDALLVRGQVEVLAHGSPGVPGELLAAASDHRPVLAVLEL